MDEGTSILVNILGAVIGIVLLLAIVQLFSIAGSLRAIKQDLRSILQNGVNQGSGQPASPVIEDVEERRKHMAAAAANWPTYGDKDKS